MKSIVSGRAPKAHVILLQKYNLDKKKRLLECKEKRTSHLREKIKAKSTHFYEEAPRILYYPGVMRGGSTSNSWIFCDRDNLATVLIFSFNMYLLNTYSLPEYFDGYRNIRITKTKNNI